MISLLLYLKVPGYFFLLNLLIELRLYNLNLMFFLFYFLLDNLEVLLGLSERLFLLSENFIHHLDTEFQFRILLQQISKITKIFTILPHSSTTIQSLSWLIMNSDQISHFESRTLLFQSIVFNYLIHHLIHGSMNYI